MVFISYLNQLLSIFEIYNFTFVFLKFAYELLLVIHYCYFENQYRITINK